MELRDFHLLKSRRKLLNEMAGGIGALAQSSPEYALGLRGWNVLDSQSRAKER